MRQVQSSSLRQLGGAQNGPDASQCRDATGGDGVSARRVKRNLALLVVVAVVATGCINGVKAGQRCRTTDWGADATHVFRCERGRWVRKATKAQVATLFLAIIRARTTTTVPSRVNLAGVSTVAVGDGFTCVNQRGVICWGRNDQGQLRAPASGPMDARLLSSTTSRVYAGSAHACTGGPGPIECWGSNSNGQASPLNTLGAVELALGDRHSCASRIEVIDGEVGTSLECWGDNTFGQAPPKLSFERSFRIRAGGDNTCIQAGVDFGCAGANDQGQLGSSPDGGGTFRSLGVPGIQRFAVGAKHVCLIYLSPETGGLLFCGGDNDNGQLGVGNRVDDFEFPEVPGGLFPTEIAAGGGTTCATKFTQVFCWGANDRGQTGTGVVGDVLVPTAVELPVAQWSQVAVSRTHACALSSAGMYCWGANEDGQLGTGDRVSSSTPRRVTVPRAVA